MNDVCKLPETKRVPSDTVPYIVSVIFVVEAMKMEVEVKAISAGTITSIAAESGAQVTAGEAMASIN